MQNGRPVIPKIFALDDEHFETVLCQATHRPDVVRQHKLRMDEQIGFELVAVRRDAGWHIPFRTPTRQPLPTSLEHKIELIGVNDRSLQAYVDEIGKRREVQINVPSGKTAGCTIVVESEVTNDIYIQRNGTFVQGTKLSASRAQFVCSENDVKGLLTFITPVDDRLTFIFD